MGITETWLSAITPSDYRLEHAAQGHCRGSGVGVLFRSSFVIDYSQLLACIILRVPSSSTTLSISFIYVTSVRYLSTAVVSWNLQPFAIFLTEFRDLVERVDMESGIIIPQGGFCSASILVPNLLVPNLLVDLFNHEPSMDTFADLNTLGSPNETSFPEPQNSGLSQHPLSFRICPLERLVYLFLDVSKSYLDEVAKALWMLKQHSVTAQTECALENQVGRYGGLSEELTTHLRLPKVEIPIFNVVAHVNITFHLNVGQVVGNELSSDQAKLTRFYQYMMLAIQFDVFKITFKRVSVNLVTESSSMNDEVVLVIYHLS